MAEADWALPARSWTHNARWCSTSSALNCATCLFIVHHEWTANPTCPMPVIPQAEGYDTHGPP
ncbi:hypothetical protein ABB37_05915 [Leptomonas pyrrhocoris]|uniref:Uncharacterized protein n=1 Tax=Leptomonas pyrrhocoris TaxID=157538 RepID=A0A0N0VEN3_LEPPY|nr:hypothetical protein ABB37_05915 [Leptomonas pyrrhocoris]KPA78828.1 hypothetical protein ABB37_05915 [Leptomonas pyrrhocoris]|eukprot:XP_015657267.1 hypothetical protein ABB37_05915 [Leptomonas pyrrhocoris]